MEMITGVVETEGVIFSELNEEEAKAEIISKLKEAMDGDLTPAEWPQEMFRIKDIRLATQDEEVMALEALADATTTNQIDKMLH